MFRQGRLASPNSSRLPTILGLVLLLTVQSIAFQNKGSTSKHSFGSLPLSIVRLQVSSSTYDDKDNHHENNNDNNKWPIVFLDRRSFFVSSTIASVALSGNLEARAVSTSTTMGTAARPVVVIGAGGRTGLAVTDTLTAAGYYTVTTTRTGRDPFQIIRLPAASQEKLRHCATPVDVTTAPAALADTLRSSSAVGSPSAVIFCASASKAGGTAQQVDGQGASNVAQAAHEVGARFVLVSALALDRPASKSYQVTNSMGGYVNGIMDYKRNGEDQVRSIYKDTRDYVILRPGVLLSGKTKRGAADMELNQGDTVGGGLSRDELAGVVLGTMGLSPKNTGITVEAYRRTTRTALQPDFALPSGNELTGDSYVTLFDGVKRDS